MDGEEILRIVDAIHRDKEIDKELLFQSIELALATAARKKFDAGEELTVVVDRKTGEVEAFMGDEVADFVDLGRIGAQTAKQVMIQRIREAEQEVVLHQYNAKVGELVNGVVHRIEGGNLIINLGKGEGILPRSETVRTEQYAVGDRIKAIIIEVKKIGLRVRIILSRAHADLVRCLFEVEVPEIADGVIDIKDVAREPGFRTKIAVASYDDRVDSIGACVGIRGTRIKAITEELNGEKVDIIPWSDDPLVFVENSLRPAGVARIELHEDQQVADILVNDDQLSLAIGRRGQNVRLASRLTGWDIRLQSVSEYDEKRKAREATEGSPIELAEDSPAEGAPEEAGAEDASAEAGKQAAATDEASAASGDEVVAEVAAETSETATEAAAVPPVAGETGTSDDGEQVEEGAEEDKGA